jgi:putative transposase
LTSRHVVVDPVGVCEHALSETYSLERKRAVSFEKLIEAVGFGNREPDVLSSLASRLARLERRLTKEDHQLVQQLNGGKSLAAITTAIVKALDPDVQLEVARQMAGVGRPGGTRMRKSNRAGTGTCPYGRGQMYDSRVHHRRSIRLRGYDYSRPGAYAVTICAHLKQPVFGDIVEGKTVSNEVGQMVQDEWEQMPNQYPGCGLDAFVVMPNHIHGIIVINPAPAVGAGPCARPHSGKTDGSMSLPDLVHRFKSLTTARYRQGVVTRGWHALDGKLWQRNYYEHIIRDDDELQKIREYIATNPVRWETDWENILGP